MNDKTAKFNTICRDCIFAEFNDDHTEQVGCEFGRLDKFKLKNKATIQTDKETDLKYYNIDTICNACRDNTNKYTNPIEEVKKEIRVNFDFIILADSNREDWEEAVLNTAENLLSHSILPEHLIFGFYQKRILFHKFDNKLKKIFKDHDITYNIVNILEPIYDSWKLIDIFSKKTKSQYFTLLEIDGKLPNNWIEKINHSINEDLNNISMVRPISKLTGLTIQRLLYKILDGSNGTNILDKIQTLATEQNLESMIRHFDEL